jgi:hypothetical protein
VVDLIGRRTLLQDLPGVGHHSAPGIGPDGDSQFDGVLMLLIDGAGFSACDTQIFVLFENFRKQIGKLLVNVPQIHKSSFITYDVATMDIWEEYVQKDFVKSWKKQATTLVLSYPPEKEGMLPDGIHHRLEHLSDNYLHFQLHYLDRPEDSVSLAHLSKAAGAKGTFFFPVTALYWEFPSMRASLGKQFDINLIAESIKEYFWNDFDEGIHRAGQRHEEHEAQKDWALGTAVSYLICNKRFDLADALISRINDQGQLSKETLAEIGLMDLSLGKFAQGLDRIQNAGEESAAFYVGLARLKKGDTRGAMQELVKTIERRA